MAPKSEGTEGEWGTRWQEECQGGGWLGMLTFATGSLQEELADSSPRLCKEKMHGEVSNRALGPPKDNGGPHGALNAAGIARTQGRLARETETSQKHGTLRALRATAMPVHIDLPPEG